MADVRIDGVEVGDLVMVTEKTGGVPVTGRLMQVGRVYDFAIHVCYLVDSTDVDPQYGRWHKQKHPNCQGLGLYGGCFRKIS